ncbi:MAG: FAD-binding oxidoreductase [Candidatus Eremiobacteraeota bacterium]|nr:FAD-binding oxidoreductase [Candidatus Eremiobacteraeota bacterium]
MKRKTVVKAIAALPLAPTIAAVMRAIGSAAPFTRARPGTARWPSRSEWARLRSQVGGRLLKLQSAFTRCSSKTYCAALFKNLRNPYYVSDTPNVTQTLGWADAWVSHPSVYAVPATSAADVAAAVNFSREHHLRVAVRGGGHSYQGTSNAPDSLLIWTHPMNDITLHDAFVPQSCTSAPVHAVSVGSGCIWGHVYDAVTTRAGRYVQGGGCTTVGVAGLVSSGGFGSFSKKFGSAAGGLLEAEVVTADGRIRVANACQNSDLFWALKGGGGGTFGVITRLTLLTHELPQQFGAVYGLIKAKSDDAYHRLIERAMTVYAEQLHNEHFGEQFGFRHSNRLSLSLVCQGLDQSALDAIWKPFFDWLRAAPQDYSFEEQAGAIAFPARAYWNPDLIKQLDPHAINFDPRTGANPTDFWWAGDSDQVGQFMYGYESLWLPSSLLVAENRERFVDALFAATRHWTVGLHFNKGLSGAPDDALTRSRDSATNPAMLDAFALAITASSNQDVYPGVPGHEVDFKEARSYAARVHGAGSALRAIVPDGGSYVSEASYFDPHWQQQYWGPNYARLAQIKQKYDPAGLFIVHNGVGSEQWSRDGFTRLS